MPRWLKTPGKFGPAIAMLLFTAIVGFPLHAVEGWGAEYANFCLRQAPGVLTHYGSFKPDLLSRDDGVIAFATGFPATSGTQLALDKQALEALHNGTFQKLLAERNVDRLTSLYYARAGGLRLNEQSPRVQRFASRVLQHAPERKYQVEYVNGNFGILRAVGLHQLPSKR